MGQSQEKNIIPINEPIDRQSINVVVSVTMPSLDGRQSHLAMSTNKKDNESSPSTTISTYSTRRKTARLVHITQETMEGITWNTSSRSCTPRGLAAFHRTSMLSCCRDAMPEEVCIKSQNKHQIAFEKDSLHHAPAVCKNSDTYPK